MSAQLGALGAAWKHSFRQAAAGSGPYTRGLALYRAGAVPQAHADAGLLLACVRPKNGPARRARITVPMTSRSHRQVLAARLAADPRALAALLAGKLPAHLAACDPDTGTPGLVPEPSELGFSCTCQRGPAIGLCDHSAALGHALADRLTSTPTLMLTARGLSTTQLADDARALIDGAALVLPADRSGAVHAEHAYALWHHHTGGPDPRPAEPELDEPVPPTIPEPPEPAPSAADLDWLICDAAARATELLTATEPPPPHDPLTDTIRALATPTGFPRLPETADRTEHSEGKLRRLLIAYRHGGPGAVHAADQVLPADPGTMAAAVQAIASRRAGLAELTVTANQITDAAAGIQIRLGPDDTWYPFTSSHQDWRPAPGASPDPATAYSTARRARQARPTRL